MWWWCLAGTLLRVHYSRVHASQEHRKKFLALTRAISPRLAEGELTHLERSPIDIDAARVQHAAYARALASLGCDVREVEAAPEYPDSVFIEDTAVVFDEIAVITRPGAESRRGEIPGVERALAPLRPLAHIRAPGTIDGGDVLVVGKWVFVGRTGRTNDEGIVQLRAVLAPFGYVVEAVEVTGCLHLKTAVTALDDHTVLVNPAWIAADALAGLARVEVDPTEPMGANVVRVGHALLYGAAYPRTLARLQVRGYAPVCVDASEVAKAEGAVTCCSLVLKV
jgi:dimethylargininase